MTGAALKKCEKSGQVVATSDSRIRPVNKISSPQFSNISSIGTVLRFQCSEKIDNAAVYDNLSPC